MSLTLEVIKFRDVIPVTSIPRFVPGLSLRTVELKGQDFSSVERVMINDAEVPEFIIINKQTIYAQFPPNVKTVRTIQVTSSKFTRTALASRVDFEVGNRPRSIDGILKLSQLFIRWLLTSPGSDVYNPNEGGGLQEVAGLIGTTGRAEKVMAAVARAVTTTADQIRRAQISSPGLPLSERLLAATILDLGAIKTTDEVRIRTRIESVAGEDGIASLTL